jgi:hypothetical protein
LYDLSLQARRYPTLTLLVEFLSTISCSQATE